MRPVTKSAILKLAAILLSGVSLLLPPGPAMAGVDRPTADPIAPVKGACNTTKTKYITVFDSHSMSSTTFVNVANTAIAIRLAKAGCIIITFASEASAAADTAMLVQPLVDGLTDYCKPAPTYFVRSGAVAIGDADRSMTFVCKNVPKGKHRVKMQFRSSTGGSVQLFYRTLTLQY